MTLVLDIGCGDGFFARRFFAPRASHVDAVDVEPSAIKHARRHNAASNVSYALLDATSDHFPRDRYDVIVLDGALGHFRPDVTARLLEKIHDALAPEGAFAGSESLGIEGSDHHQFFETLGDLRALFAPTFKHVQLRVIEYELPGGLLCAERRTGAARTSRLASSRHRGLRSGAT